MEIIMSTKSKKIILDGFWRVGKTTLCKRMELGGWIYIKEPDHTKERWLNKNTTSVNVYYILAHSSNMIRFAMEKQATILERCIIASFAYNYAVGDITWKVIWSRIENDAFLRQYKTYCFYRTYENFVEDMSYYKENRIIPQKIGLRKFYRRFLHALSLVAKKYSHNVELIKLEKNQFASDYFNPKKT